MPKPRIRKTKGSSMWECRLGPDDWCGYRDRTPYLAWQGWFRAKFNRVLDAMEL